MGALDAAWSRLEAAGEAARGRRIADLFAAEPDRLATLGVTAAGLELDLSKQPWSLADPRVCLDLARAAGVEAARDRQFAGEAVNASEGRAALHMALRAPRGAGFKAQGEPVSPEIDAMRTRMAAFADAVRSGARKGATGRPFRSLVHIGIGGSDFGPRLVWDAPEAARPADRRPLRGQCRSRRHGRATHRPRPGRDPGGGGLQDLHHPGDHDQRRDGAGLAAGRPGPGGRRPARRGERRAGRGPGVRGPGRPGVRLPRLGRRPLFGLVVGGVVLRHRPRRRRLRAPAGRRRGHGRPFPHDAAGGQCARAAGAGPPLQPQRPGAPGPRRGAPTRNACISCPPSCSSWRWNRTAEAWTPRAARSPTPRPSGVRRRRQPMCSTPSSSSCTRDGRDPPSTSWRCRQASEGDPAAQQILLANAIAQAEALMVGRSEAHVRAELTAKGVPAAEIETLAPQRTFPGDRPSAFILMDRLDPEALGALLALYEHKTFVEGVIWRNRQLRPVGRRARQDAGHPRARRAEGRRAGRPRSLDGGVDRTAEGLAPSASPRPSPYLSLSLRGGEESCGGPAHLLSPGEAERERAGRGRRRRATRFVHDRPLEGPPMSGFAHHHGHHHHPTLAGSAWGRLA